MTKTSWLGLIVCCWSLLLGGARAAVAAPYNPPDPPQELIDLLDRSRDAWQASKFDEASTLFAATLVKTRELKNRDVEALALAMSGAMALQRGQISRSVDLFNHALPISRALGDEEGQSISLMNLGSCYMLLGKHQQSLQVLQEALGLQHDLKDKEGEAMSLLIVGHVYLSMGMAKQALNFYKQSWDLSHGNNVNNVNGALSDYMQSIFKDPLMFTDLRRSLPIIDEVIKNASNSPDKTYLASALQNKGTLYLLLNQPEQALDCFEQSLKLFKESQTPWAAKYAVLSSGIAQFNLGQYQKALVSFQQALPQTQTDVDRRLEAAALYGLGMTQSALNHAAEGEAKLQQSLALSEQLRGETAGSPETRVGFMQTTGGPYYGYISLLLKQGKVAAAFDWAEKVKARVLLDSLFKGRMDLSRYATPQEEQHESELRQAADAANTELLQVARQAQPDLSQLQTLKEKLLSAESAWQLFVDNLTKKYPDLARKQGAHTVTSSEIARLLPPDTVLLEYLVLQGQMQEKTLQNKVVLFCISNNSGKGQVTVYTINKPLEELVELVGNFKQDCARPDSAFRGKSRELYDLLIAPARKELAGKKRVIVCPDAMLWATPFQAFADANEKYLVENYEVDYSYSATITGAALNASDTKRPTPTKQLFAVANPNFGTMTEAPTLPTSQEDGGRAILATSRAILATSREIYTGTNEPLPPLPGTQLEADAIRADFPDAVIETGVQAQEATVKEQIEHYRYLHFATHGLFNTNAPMLSSIALAQPPANSPEDGFLSAREIANLNLSADLVVLSACETGQGESTGSEGLVGLTWALFAAGAPTQIVSQWTVDDSSTAELMKQFYNQLKAGQPKGAALRSAQLKLMHTERYTHPYYWAPFILMGNWDKGR